MIPAPKITPDTKLLVFDVESNGLHGAAFAVGAVLVDCKNRLVDEFSARCPIEGPLDPWVKENVLPALTGFDQTHDDAKSMREAFWQWYQRVKDSADYIIADNAYPVEDRFLSQCQQDDLDRRYWEHPFPLFDLSSMLLAVGIKPQVERNRFVGDDQIPPDDIKKHNPRHDAWATALATVKALKMAGRLEA